MQIQDAQQDVRSVFMNGSVGQVVSGLIWLISAGLGTWVSPSYGIISLILGGTFIFLITQLVLKLLGRQASLPKGHPMNALAMQVAFTVPIAIPVILAATGLDQNWFYPAFMIILGAHYLPFIFLYGMWQFGVLAALLIGGGVALRYLVPDTYTLGAWLTGVVLILFGLIVSRTVPVADPQASRKIGG